MAEIQQTSSWRDLTSGFLHQKKRGSIYLVRTNTIEKNNKKKAQQQWR